MLTKTKRTDAPVEGPPPAIVMMPIGDLRLATEAPKGIDLTIRDSSSGSPLTDAELKASIYAKGIIQPLIFKNVEGKHYVIAGNRRLRFLREIFGVEANVKVQTQDVDKFDGDWREIAMDTNLSLPPHLVERYHLIVTLTKDGKMSPDQARARFGMTERQFNQVMALGKMSETVREAWRSGEIDTKTAQAFTLEPSTKEQDRIFELCKKQGHNGQINAHDVRRRIIPENQRDSGKLVAFVGIETCKKAKIIKQEDLFSISHIVTDLKALKKLAGDKLAERCRQIVVDGGWSWAIPEEKIDGLHYHYGTLQPTGKTQPTADEAIRMRELKQLLTEADNSPEQPTSDYDDWTDELEKITEAVQSRGFTPAQKAKSGCILKISHDGTLSIEYGKVTPEARKNVEASERRAAAPPPTKKKPGSKAADPVLTNALAERLSEALQRAGADALKSDHAVATAAIIAAISSDGHILDIRVGEGHGFGRDRKATSFAEVFHGALKATPEAREAMFAQIAAQALSIVVHNGAGKMPLDDGCLVDMFEAMNGTRVTDAIMREFDAKDYFKSIGMGAIVEAVKCSMGGEHHVKVAKMKNPEAAKFAAANVSKTGWLPKQLRTEHYTGPVEEAEVKKAKAKALGDAKEWEKASKKPAKKKSKK